MNIIGTKKKKKIPNIDDKEIPFEKIFLNQNSDILSEQMLIVTKLKNKIGVSLVTQGYSGTGKSYILFGDKDKQIDGLVQSILRNLGVEDSMIRIYEIYGYGLPYDFYYENPQYMVIKHELNQVDPITYNNYNIFIEESDIDNKLLIDFTGSASGSDKFPTYTSFKNNQISQLSYIFDNVDKKRKEGYILDGNKFKTIKTTFNNPESSRSILVIEIKVLIDGINVPLVFIDMPGRENIYESFKKNFTIENFDLDINNEEKLLSSILFNPINLIYLHSCKRELAECLNNLTIENKKKFFKNSLQDLLYVFKEVNDVIIVKKDNIHPDSQDTIIDQHGKFFAHYTYRVLGRTEFTNWQATLPYQTQSLIAFLFIYMGIIPKNFKYDSNKVDQIRDTFYDSSLNYKNPPENSTLASAIFTDENVKFYIENIKDNINHVDIKTISQNGDDNYGRGFVRIHNENFPITSNRWLVDSDRFFCFLTNFESKFRDVVFLIFFINLIKLNYDNKFFDIFRIIETALDVLEDELYLKINKSDKNETTLDLIMKSYEGIFINENINGIMLSLLKKNDNLKLDQIYSNSNRDAVFKKNDPIRIFGNDSIINNFVVKITEIKSMEEDFCTPNLYNFYLFSQTYPNILNLIKNNRTSGYDYPPEAIQAFARAENNFITKYNNNVYNNFSSRLLFKKYEILDFRYNLIYLSKMNIKYIANKIYYPGRKLNINDKTDLNPIINKFLEIYIEPNNSTNNPICLDFNFLMVVTNLFNYKKCYEQYKLIEDMKLFFDVLAPEKVDRNNQIIDTSKNKKIFKNN